MTNEALDKCKAQIKRHEGLRLNAYQDSLGFWTIGIGHYLGLKPVIAQVTKAEAEALFEGDFAEAIEDAQKLIKEWDAMGDVRQAAIVNMAFNMGFDTLKEFTQTIAHIEVKNYQKAADAMLASKWAKQTGKRAIELSQQMKTGVWQ